MKEDKLIEAVDDLIVAAQPCGRDNRFHAKEIINLVRGSGWISVETELPEEGLFVITLCELGGLRFQKITYMLESTETENLEWVSEDKVTHWTPLRSPPLPSPPTNKGEE